MAKGDVTGQKAHGPCRLSPSLLLSASDPHPLSALYSTVPDILFTRPQKMLSSSSLTMFVYWIHHGTPVPRTMPDAYDFRKSIYPSIFK